MSLKIIPVVAWGSGRDSQEIEPVGLRLQHVVKENRASGTVSTAVPHEVRRNKRVLLRVVKVVAVHREIAHLLCRVAVGAVELDLGRVFSVDEVHPPRRTREEGVSVSRHRAMHESPRARHLYVGHHEEPAVLRHPQLHMARVVVFLAGAEVLTAVREALKEAFARGQVWLKNLHARLCPPRQGDAHPSRKSR